MKITTTISALALAAGLALSGPAFAQTMINGVEISEGDLGAVQQRCDDLKTEFDTSGPATTNSGVDQTEDTVNDGNTTGAADATLNSQPDVNAMANALSTIDLETITLDACVEAGLVTR